MSAALPDPVHFTASEIGALAGNLHDPLAALGPRDLPAAGGRPVQQRVTLLIPHASRVRVSDPLSAPPEGSREFEARRLGTSDLFVWEGAAGRLPAHYRVSWWDSSGQRHDQIDPYSFRAPLLPQDGLYLFNEGRQYRLWDLLGARLMTIDGITGVRFSVWAPNASRVSVVGDFCRWDGRRYPMRACGPSGVWELFLPGVDAHTVYKFEIRNRDTGAVFLKTDPMARATERRPATASVVEPLPGHPFADRDWLQQRARRDWLHAPMSIHEVHLGSWRRGDDGRFLTYRELAAELIPRAAGLGFTHLELLPITEHPLDESWGYQTSGYYAPTSRHGSADDLRYFVDECHKAGLGVILDWVPGHFPRDAHGLAHFDGTALYEYADPRKAEHKDWGTLIFNYERHEVRSFLISSALYWLEEFHFDGLRVDAVASMLYLDFSRKDGDFVPNRHGGNQNLEAIDFLRELNAAVHARCPGAVVLAEESTDWPMVSRPAHDGGLGFSMKWNMGWMHDTLAYFREDPVHRAHHQNRLTFAMMYAYTENFVLPLSHDEVVHLKRPLVYKMPGDRWQQFANLRALYTYMWTFPGKKLLFMGGEFAQTSEWNHAVGLPWHLRDFAEHLGVESLVSDLNHLYRDDPRLHAYEFEPRGFRWVDCEDRAQSVLSYLRGDFERGAGTAAATGTATDALRNPLLVVLNLTPVPRQGYRIGVPRAGIWRERLNSDAARYGGSNLGNISHVVAEHVPAHGHPHSIVVTLPPLAGLVFEVAG
jgi:1,4-alpha-glucan branching enzyme